MLLSKMIDFNKAEFYETSLVDVDFSTCNIEGCKFDYKSIKGIVIDLESSISKAVFLILIVTSFSVSL